MDIPTITTEKLIEIVTEAIEVIFVPAYLLTGAEATGDFRRSLNVRQSGEKSISIYGIEYSPEVQYGTGPNDPSPKIPDLIRWVEAKLGIYGKEAVGIAYAVRNKISNEGTEAYKQGGREIFEILESPEFMNYIRTKIGLEIKVNIELFIKTQFRSLG